MLAFAFLAASMFTAFDVLIQTVFRLKGVGWDLYLGREGAAPFIFFFICLGNDVCSDAFIAVWWQEYPVYLPILAVVTLWTGAVFSVLAQSKVGNRSPGGARWTSSSDLKLYLKGEPSSPQRGYLGLSPHGKMLRLPERLRCAHTLIVGATGARKSTGYHKPNMVMDARDGVSAIVIDLKYPDTQSGFFDMVPLFSHAGHDVQLFLPYGEHTLRFPLLAATSTLAGASEMADMISPNTGEADVDFYRTEERRLVTGLLMGLARDDKATLGELYRLLARGRTSVQSYVHKHPDAEVRAHLGGFFDFDLKTQGNLIGGLAGALQGFADPRLDRATTASPIPMENIDLPGIGLRPTLLYIGIPQEHLQGTRAKVLLKLIKRAIDLALLRTANEHAGRLPNHTSFYLDEFANLGVLPNIGENFATMRSRRVAYHVSLQNRAQGEALYGRDQFRSFFTNNFQQVLIFPRSLRFEDAEYFSRAMGMKAVLDKTKGTSREGFFSPRRRSELIREVAEPLLSLEAMMTWPEAVGVLLASGSLPAKVLLPRLDEARILGTRNPLHDVYQAIEDNLPPKVVAEVIIHGRMGKAGSSQSKEPVSIRLQPPSLPETAGLNLIKPSEIADSAPHQILVETSSPQGGNANPQQTMLDWVDTLLQQPVAAKFHLNPKTKQLSKVSLQAVPSSLTKPDQLAAWIERGWVKVSGDEIGLVAKGLALLGETRLRKLKHLTSGVGANLSKGESGPSNLTEHDALKLRRYIQSHGQLLKGHPQRKDADSAGLPAAIGVYQPATVLLERKLVETLFDGQIPSELPTRKEGAQGAQRWVVEIPMSELRSLPQLKTWCETNWHRLKGHPTYVASQDRQGNIGIFLPTFIALPKQVLLEVLGHMPHGGTPTRPTLHGKRPYLTAFELPLETP